jgi:hypothetical protein
MPASDKQIHANNRNALTHSILARETVMAHGRYSMQTDSTFCAVGINCETKPF